MAKQLDEDGFDLSPIEGGPKSQLDEEGFDLSPIEGGPLRVEEPRAETALDEDGFDLSAISGGPRTTAGLPTAGGITGLGVSGPAISGLGVTAGHITSLPDTLPMEAPDSLKAEPGKLSLDQLNNALRRAASKYNRTRDHEEKVKILGEFIREWDPDKAEALGISREGYIEPTGLWKVLDLVDIVFDRWARVSGETLWEHKETNAANFLAGKEKAGIGNLGHLWKQNWEEDKGQLGKGGEAIKNWALYMTTPFGIDTQEEAEGIFNRSAGYDAAEQDVADSITSGWHNMMGVVKGRSREETEFIIDEALAAGGTGGHMAIDLVGLMGVSSLNFAGMGPFKGAMQGMSKAPLVKNLTRMGLKVNPLGNARSSMLELSAMPLARKSILDELEGVVVGAEKIGPPTETRAALDGLAKLSDEMTAVEKKLGYMRGLRESAEGGGRAADEIGDVVDEASAAAAVADIDRRVTPLVDEYKRLMDEFDQGFNALSEIGGQGRVPGEVLFGGIQARAIGIAGDEVGRAVDIAFKGSVKSGPVGAQSVPMLSEARAWALEGGLSVTEVEQKWLAALKTGEKEKKVVVSLGAYAEGGKVKTAPVWLSPGEARVYEQAKEGLHGAKAEIAAYYPDKDMLQHMLGKKKFARLAEKASNEIVSIAHGRGFGGSGRRAIAGGVRALRGKTKADAVFQADRIVTNVEPLSFAINHALMKKAAWIETVRIPLAGVASLSRRPMHYATKGVDGKWTPIAREHLTHPGMFHKMTTAERQRMTAESFLRAEWPVWKAKFENAAGDNPELLKLGRQAYELGWASEDAAMATGADILNLAAVNNLNETIDKLVRLGKDADLGEGRILTVLSEDDVRQAQAAIAHLSSETVIDTKVFEDLLDGYVKKTDGLADDISDLSGLGWKAKAEYLEGLRAQVHVLHAATEASVESRIKFQAELAVGRIADDFKPELKHISDELGKIQSQLAATTADVVKVDESAEQLRAALLAVGKGGDEAAAEALIKESDEFVNAYKKTLEDFRRSVAEEFGDEAAELADEALTGAMARTAEPAAAPYVYKKAEGIEEINSRTFYHGTGKEGLSPDTIDVNMTKVEGLFGAGFYLTDRMSVAQGYAKSRSKKSSPVVYGVELDLNKVMDLTKPVDSDLMEAISYGWKHQLTEGGYWDEFVEYAQAGRSGEDVYLRLSEIVEDFSQELRVPMSDLYESFQDMGGLLSGKGWEAIQHQGGLRVGKDKPHNVVILINPTGELGFTAGDVARNPIVSMEVIPQSLSKADAAPPKARSPLPLSDSAQAYVDSVRVAWNTGDEVPITSLFDAMWSRLGNELDPTMLGKRRISEVNLPKGSKAILTRLGALSEKLDGTNASLMAARAGDSAIDLAEAEANYNKAKTAYDTARRSYEGKVYTNLHGLKLDNKLIHKAGSQERRILEALELHYKNRMASITSHVANEAESIRKASKEALANLPDSLIKKGFVTAGREDELKSAVDKLGVTLFGRDISVNLPATKDMSADILLKKAVARARRSKDPRERAAVLMAEIEKIEQKLAKVGDGLPESDLAAAIKELDRARTKKKAMPKKDVQIHVDKFLDEIRDADFDLRHPDDVSRAIENRLTAQYNVIESEKLLFKARLEALRSADIADYIPNLSPVERARIASLLKNKKLRNVLPGSDGGPAILLKDTQKRLAAAQSRLERYIADGSEEAVSKQRTIVAGLEEQVRILGNEEDVKRVVHVAKEMKNFFDMHLERLVEAGVIDKAFDTEEFFARVDVGAFFPHILSQAASKRAAGFGVGGAGRIGRSLVEYFGKERKIAGVIEDINEGKRALRAEQILFHAARRGAHGEGAAQAAAKGSGELKKFIKDSGQSYDDLVDEIKEGALLAEYDELFESDVLVAMEYYHRKSSSAVADARFINTTLDLFPNGRMLAQMKNLEERNKAAESMGYVPLGEVEYLQSVLQKQLPKGLRRLSKDLKMRVIKGARLDEIQALVRAELGQDVAADVLHALTSDKLTIPYVPIQVKEYLNWRNSADALLAKKTLGTDVWDGLQAWAKTQATIVALAHIGRNVVGNMVSTVQEIGLGALNFDTQLKAMRIWGSWGDDNLKAVLNIGPHSMSVQDWRKTFSSRGFYDEALSSDFLEEATGISGKAIPTTKQTMSQLAGTAAGAVTGMALGSAIGLGAPAFFLGGVLGMKVGKRWSGVKAVRGGKTYKKVIGDVVDEIKASPKEGIVRTGGKITGGIGGGIIGSAVLGVGAIPGAFLGATSMEDFVKMMGGLNQAAESQARLSMAVGLLKRGDDIDTALMKVNRSLRDYSDLTPLEKNVFRRFFFFYTWEAGNLKYQLNWMKENPGTARMVSAFTNGIYQMQFTDEDIAKLPEHYRYPVVVRSGPAKLIALSGLPHQPILELFRSKEGMPLQGLATRMSPPILAFMEMTFGGGKSFYYGKPIKELNNINQLKEAPPLLKMIFGYPDKPNYYVPVYKNGVKTGRTREVRKSENPVMFYLAKKLPGWRWMNQYMTISSESFNSYALEAALTPEEEESARATHFERAMMFTLGWKQTAIDWDYQGYKVSKEMEDRMLDTINNQFPMAVGQRRYLRKKLSASPNETVSDVEE